MHVIQRDNIHLLFSALKNSGYAIIGPTLRDDAIVYDHIETVEDLPVGWTDRQEAGKYRVQKRTDQALFGYVVGPLSWKQFLFPPKEKLWQAKKSNGSVQVVQEKLPNTKVAFLGIRSCELSAIRIQDKVFTEGKYVDTGYQHRRKSALLIAVNCTQPGGTCFCVSMNTGPMAKKDFDLSLTEIIDGQKHYFIARAGTDRGTNLLNQIPHESAEPAHQNTERDRIEAANQNMGRTMDNHGIKELLYNNAEHPQWENIAERCLTCANCTMACPTCFCSSVDDVTDLTGDHVERWRQWDSCFNLDFSYIHGGHIRRSTQGRYRQWMTHKLASWQDQFDTSGCVGCGRCITWCPVGIDITEEIKVFQQNPVSADKE